MLRNRLAKDLLALSRTLVQPLMPNFHKGQAGRIAVIGGCEDYTGAPYFSSHSAALVGADLSHVVCEKMAAPVIKSYSPDLMVHPYLYELSNPDIEKHLSASELSLLQKVPVEELLEKKQPKLDQLIEDIILPKIIGLLNRVDIVVIGPGFGRDALMLKTLIRLIEEIKVLNKPVILDADSLYLLSIQPHLIANYKKATLTPNVMEFQRLADKLGVDHSLSEKDIDKLTSTTIELSKKLGGVTVVRKGGQEIIAKNDEFVINDVPGSLRRVGGQGDSLTGALATFLNWAYHYQDGVWETQSSVLETDLILLACFAACTTVRFAANKAYRKYGRAMQTSNLHQFLGEAYRELYDEEMKL